MSVTEWDGALVLTTDRLILRRFRETDLPAYAALNADLEVMKYLGGQALSPAQTTASAAGAQNAFAREGIGKIAIERTADGTFLGMCGLSREPWYPNDVEIGWRLARPYWGSGYASEAASAWLRYAFDRLGLDRVISIADVPNVSSIAVMQRLGMVLDHTAWLEEGDDRFEAVIYAMSREQWQAQR